MFLFFCKKIDVNEFLHPHQKLYSHFYVLLTYLVADCSITKSTVTDFLSFPR